MTKINFSNNLTRFREAKGLSKEELGERIGVSGVTIGYWESGRNEPRMGKVELIAQVLNVDIDDLLFGTEYKAPEIDLHNSDISEEKKKGIQLLLSLSDEDVKMFNLLMERSLNKE